MKNNQNIIILLLTLTLTFYLLCFTTQKVYSATSEVGSWQFSSADNFTISDVSKVTFFDNSVKILPTGFENSWGKTWHDTHFAPDTGQSGAYGVALDSSDYIYFGGVTNNGASGVNKAFMVKVNQDMTESWYKNDYAPGEATDAVTGRMNFDSNGDLITLVQYIQAGQAYTRLIKIDPDSGSVIWQENISKTAGLAWISAWDGATGPVIDSEGNIYFSVANGTWFNWDNGEPTKIYKYDSEGNQLWVRTDSLIENEVGALGWDDNWDMVVDSEDSVYISMSGDLNEGGQHQLYFGLLKYDKDGNRQWHKLKDFGLDAWQAPRGVSVDSGDNIYQNGNISSHGPCGIIKYNKDGVELGSDQVGERDFIDYCWGSKINQFDKWMIAGPYGKGYDVRHQVDGNSQYFYANSYDKKIYIWNKSDYTLAGTLTNTRNSTDVFMDDDYIYASSANPDAEGGLIRIFNRSDFSYQTNITTPVIQVKTVASDTSYLYAQAWGGVRVFNKSGFGLQTTLAPPAGSVGSLYSDDDYIYGGNINGDVNLWNKNLSYNTALTDAGGATYTVFADANHIIAGSDDNNVYVWNKSDLSLAATLIGSTDDVRGVYSDANYVYAASKDKKVYVWDKSDWLAETNFTYSYYADSVYSDDNYLYVGVDPYDNYIYVYDKSDFSLERTITDTVNPGSYIMQYNTDLEEETIVDYANKRFGDYMLPPRDNTDRFGNIYSVASFYDHNYSEKSSVLVTKNVNSFPNTNPGVGTPLTLITKTGIAYDATLSGFDAEYGSMDQADAGFQLSSNGTVWYYWNGSSWALTIGNDYNTETEVNLHIDAFASQFGAGELYIKTFLITEGTLEVDLQSITIYRTTIGPAPVQPSGQPASDQETGISGLTILPKTGIN